jgi:tRNA modification GTPase
VTPIAGTTRDVVQQTIQIEGVPIHVIDTAGLRGAEHTADEVERIGIQRAWGQIENADVVLFLHDLTRLGQADYDAADVEIARVLQDTCGRTVPVMDVFNKADAVTTPSHGELFLSAETGLGLTELRQQLLAMAGWQGGGDGLYIARERHLQALLRVGEHLALADEHLDQQAQALDLLAEELRLAQNALNEITGAFSSDDLLGVIFSSFCIGK